MLIVDVSASHWSIYYWLAVDCLHYVLADTLCSFLSGLPFQGEEYAMVILVPRFRDTLLSLISELTMSHVQTIINQLGAPSRQLVDLKLPKFDIETRTSLVGSLRDVMITWSIIWLITVKMTDIVLLCSSRWASAVCLSLHQSWSTSMRTRVFRSGIAYTMQDWP